MRKMSTHGNKRNVNLNKHNRSCSCMKEVLIKNVNTQSWWKYSNSVHSYFAWVTVKRYCILEKFGEFIPQIKTCSFHLIQWSISGNLDQENNNKLEIYFYIKIFIATCEKDHANYYASIRKNIIQPLQLLLKVSY